MNILDKVKSDIQKHSMFSESKNVLVALSGGADSVAMTLLLKELEQELCINLKAIHINHNLRGAESDRDEKFVIDFCKKQSIPLNTVSIDVISRAEKTGESIELAARNMRYEIFSEYSVNGVTATAHNADDNAETVIYNLIRGTGIKGLCGIPPVRGNIVRPIIGVTRDEIIEYLKSKNQTFVTDSSNLSDVYSRNKIRHSVVPSMKNISPAFLSTVTRMSGILREDNDFLDRYSEKIYLSSISSSGLSFDIKNCHDAIIKRILIKYFNSVCDAEGSLSFEIVIKMLDVVKGKIKRTSLPEDYEFTSVGNGFVIEKKSKNRDFSEKVRLIPENLQILRKYFEDITFLPKNEYKNSYFVHKNFAKYVIDCDKIIGETTIRTRTNGDKYRPLGRNVTKNVGNLLTESKMSNNMKSDLIVISDERGVIFTNFFGIDERVKADENSDKILIIHCGGKKI